MSTMFYRAFEERHRGSRELIAQRLEAYLPFVTPLKTLYEQCPVLDLGCGRGEWIELLQAQGFAPTGVDLDDGMLEACRAIGLSAKRGDALTALAELEDDSQVIISAFHLVEHIPFPDVQKLVSEALRVLKPGGLLIMETPNAENLVVGTNNFFLDPTHEKPIPHELLSFLTEYSGFARSKVIRLQEDAALQASPELTLMQVLSGVSPDYAVIAQKNAEAEQLEPFSACFEQYYGLSLEDLAQRYDHQVKQRCHNEIEKLDLPALRDQLTQFNVELQRTRQCEEALQVELQQTRRCEQALQVELRHSRQSEMDLRGELLNARQQRDEPLQTELLMTRHQREETLQAELESARVQLDRLLQIEQISPHKLDDTLQAELDVLRQQRDEALRAELQLAVVQRDEALAKAHHFWLQSCADHDQIQAITRSTSWRITAPLRWMLNTSRTLPSAVVRTIKSGPRRLAGAGVRFILARPVLHNRLHAVLKRSPRLLALLKRIAHSRGLLGSPQQATPHSDVPVHLSGLSAQARQVYHDLKKAIDQKDLR